MKKTLFFLILLSQGAGFVYSANLNRLFLPSLPVLNKEYRSETLRQARCETNIYLDIFTQTRTKNHFDALIIKQGYLKTKSFGNTSIIRINCLSSERVQQRVCEKYSDTKNCYYTYSEAEIIIDKDMLIATLEVTADDHVPVIEPRQKPTPPPEQNAGVSSTLQPPDKR